MICFTHKYIVTEGRMNMASLTHVCMWSDDGWKPISSEQAAQLHPGGTVSAHSGLFMCELCGQYVLLTDGEYQVRHFRHSSREKSKDCPERKSSVSASYSYKAVEHDLPIRLVGITPTSFRLELGLIRIPSNMISNKLQIEIKPQYPNSRSYIYLKERLNSDGISYVFIGDIPCEKYNLIITGGSEAIHEYWPREINGINPIGTLFDASSGKMLPYDSDVEIEKEYYFLTKWNLSSHLSKIGINIREITAKRISCDVLHIYSLKAKNLNENAAKFFLKHHYRLTGQPVAIQPIWPLYVEGSYLIKHNYDKVLLHVRGNASAFKAFPNTTIRSLSYTSLSKVYEVSCLSRQQLVSAGRIKALQYTYFWREEIRNEKNIPEFIVTDVAENKIDPGESNVIPKNGIIRFKAHYDGEIIIKKAGVIVDKRKLPADTMLEIEGVSFDTSVILIVGLDYVWELNIRKDYYVDSNIENELLEELCRLRGSIIPSPHSLRNIAVEFKTFPQIYQWILKCIRNGVIYERSFRKLQKIYRNKKLQK